MGLLAKADKTRQDAKQWAVKQPILDTKSSVQEHRQGPRQRQLSIASRLIKVPIGVKRKGNERQQLKEGGPDEQQTPLLAWGQVPHTCGCGNNYQSVQQLHLQGMPCSIMHSLLDHTHKHSVISAAV